MSLKFYRWKHADRWIERLRNNKTLLEIKKFAVDWQRFSCRTRFGHSSDYFEILGFLRKPPKLDSEISITCGGNSVFACFSFKSRNHYSMTSKMNRNEGKSTNTKGGRSSSFPRFNQASLITSPVIGVNLDDSPLESLKLPSNSRDSVCLSSKGLTNEPGQNNCFMNCPIQVLRIEIVIL